MHVYQMLPNLDFMSCELCPPIIADDTQTDLFRILCVRQMR